jgi:hypothetical protein
VQILVVCSGLEGSGEPNDAGRSLHQRLKTLLAVRVLLAGLPMPLRQGDSDRSAFEGRAQLVVQLPYLVGIRHGYLITEISPTNARLT